MVRAAGIYAGEVLIRNLHGNWVKLDRRELLDALKVEWAVKLKCGTLANPILKCEKIAIGIRDEANSLSVLYQWCEKLGDKANVPRPL